jgi:hypothetical protein
MPTPAGWSAKRVRQFERIRTSYLVRGRSPRKAAELAARVVNKQRRASGETRKDT